MCAQEFPFHFIFLNFRKKEVIFLYSQALQHHLKCKPAFNLIVTSFCPISGCHCLFPCLYITVLFPITACLFPIARVLLGTAESPETSSRFEKKILWIRSRHWSGAIWNKDMHWRNLAGGLGALILELFSLNLRCDQHGWTLHAVTVQKGFSYLKKQQQKNRRLIGMFYVNGTVKTPHTMLIPQKHPQVSCWRGRHCMFCGFCFQSYAHDIYHLFLLPSQINIHVCGGYSLLLTCSINLF